MAEGLSVTEARQIEQHAGPIMALTESVERVVVGQRAMIRGLLIGLLTNGHVLLEGVPGLAKTLTVSTLAKSIHAEFSRVQFTPDLLPADLIGTLIYNPRDGSFSARKGPIFANIVLADEINRAPAKVQSALLEAMQERQVTIGDTTYPLDDPFLVLATQNPIEQEGTYPLPEAQVDRFMLKLKVSYPSRAEERAVIDRMTGGQKPAAPAPVVDLGQVRAARAAAAAVHIDDKIKDYIVEIVHATRRPQEHNLELGRFIEFGASPRGSISLATAAKASAFLDGRAYVTPSDVKAVAADVLRHRIVLNYEAYADDITPEKVIAQLFERIRTP